MQWNYRIQAFKKIAACAGVHGARVQTDATFNIFVNDQGSRNTNKAGDLTVLHNPWFSLQSFSLSVFSLQSSVFSLQSSLVQYSTVQVEHKNDDYKKRVKELKGQYTQKSLDLIAK